jgi:transposase
MSRSRTVKRSPKQSRRNGAKAAPRATLGSGRLPLPKELVAAGAPLDADVEMARQGRMEALKALLLAQVAAGRGAEAIDQVLGSMMALERENERLAWRVLRANRFRFGRSSEKLSGEELGQLFLALGGESSALKGAGAEAQAVPGPGEPEQSEPADATDTPSDESGDADDVEVEAAEPQGKKRRRVQQMRVDPKVERKVQAVALPEAERCCSLCGRDKKVFDHVDHESIRFVPAKIVVDVERREKAGCSHCRQDVSVAPRHQQPSVVRRVDASLLAKLVADKTSLALPVERQRRQLSRLGLHVPAKTLASYWAYTLDLIEPVAVATLSAVFGDEVVGLDDSHLKTLDKSAKHGVFRGHLWCFVGTDSARTTERVGYGYTQSWEATEIADWLGAIDGFMQGDGYAGYSTEVEDEETGETFVLIPDERRLGCGMHIRSKFHDALLAQDQRAAIPLKHFADLYEIEAECKEQALDVVTRAEQRRRRSLPIVDALDHWVDSVHPKLLPKSPLRRATTYALNQRAFFRRCFEDGRFEIDNGRVERRIRNFAVGRRNYLFTGSARGGERLAAAYTLVDNCTLLGVDGYLYLLDIIRKLEGGWPMRRLSELIPWTWAAAHQPG